MSKQLEQWLAEPPLADAYGAQRLAARKALQGARWPGRKVEAWKYTSVRALEQWQAADAPVELAPVPVVDGLDCIDLVLGADGLVLPADCPQGLSIAPLLSASAGGKALFGRVKPVRHVFGLVNDLKATQGWVVQVAAGVQIEKPLRVIYRAGAGEQHFRLLVQLEQGAALAVIEQSQDRHDSFCTAFAEYDIGAAARLEHYRLLMNDANALQVGGCHFALHEQAQLNSTLVGFGSALARLDVDVIHAGPHANASMNAIYLLDGQELFDLHSCIEHASPNGTTDEKVRGIVANKARAVFNGRIHIHRHAQKTQAQLNNRNLLLNDGAEVNTKPELEIYADDVRCAHGATVAEIDKKALYYLQSRGIDLAQARIMLNFGFINELVDEMPNQALAQWLRPQLQARFARMSEQ